MTNTPISRRALLKAAPAAAAVASTPAVAIAAPADRTSWDAAMRAYRQAQTEYARFAPRYDKLADKCRAACERVPHTEIEPTAWSGRTTPYTTADRETVVRARRDTEALAAGRMRLDNLPGLHEHYGVMAALAKAADERDSEIKRIRATFDMAAADEKIDDLASREGDARYALMRMPAPDLAALRWKLGNLREDDGDMILWAPHFTEQTFADLARLLPEAR